MSTNLRQRLDVDVCRLPLQRPFKISRGTIDHQLSVIVTLQSVPGSGAGGGPSELNHSSGLGETTRHDYYGHTTDSITKSIESVRQLVEQSPLESVEDVQSLSRQLSLRLKQDSFACSAIDQAANDLVAQKRGVPLFELLGLNWCDVPQSSITLSMDSTDQVLHQLNEYRDWPIIKLKLGSDSDEAIVRAVRQRSSATIRIDANCGWTADETIVNSVWLADLGVEFIEQPLPASACTADKAKVFKHCRLPIIADESCCLPADIAACEGHFHGINVKLSKCGGVTNAVEMLRHAKNLGMTTMAGCMIESDVAIAAATHLLPLLDYADLDGSVLLKETPFDGPNLSVGNFRRPTAIGSGVTRRALSTS